MENDQELWIRFTKALSVPQPAASEDFVSRVMGQIPENAAGRQRAGVPVWRWLVPAVGLAAAAFAFQFVVPQVETASAEELLLSDADAETAILFRADAPEQDDALAMLGKEL